jgi:hypothetical protein
VYYAIFKDSKEIIAHHKTHKSLNSWVVACKKDNTGSENPRCNVWTADITFERDGEWIPLSSIRTIKRAEIPRECDSCGGEALSDPSYKVAVVPYCDKFSIDCNSLTDQSAGHQEEVVGSNTDSLKKLNPGDILVTTAKKSRYLHISRVIRPASESEASVWFTRGGKMWRYNYKVDHVTDIIKLHNPLSSLSGCCHRGIMKELMKQIQGE